MRVAEDNQYNGNLNLSGNFFAMKPAFHPFAVSALLSYTVLILLGSVVTDNNCETLDDQKCFRVTALVPARAGSKGIKNKNLSILGNETLIGRTLRIVKECEKFDSIWVSTDGKNIADVATAYEAKVHWRHPSTATDNATTLSVVEDFLSSHPDSHIIALVQCTSPFIRSDFLCEAFDYIMREGVDCVFSAVRSHQLRWTQNEGTFPVPLNFDPKNRPRRQDWNGELVENGMFYFAKAELILQQKTLQNDRCLVFEIPKNHSLEIDTEYDLNLAAMMLALSERFRFS